MPYHVDRSAAERKRRTEIVVLLQLDRPAVGDDLDTITAPRRAALPQDRPVPSDDLASTVPPRRAAPVRHVTRPVFSDDSGRRAAVARWAGRGVCLVGILLFAALGLTLRAHVSVPGLERALFGSSDKIPRATTVPSDPSSASAARRTELRGNDSGRVGATGQPVPRSQRTPAAVATSDTDPTAGTPTGDAAAPATVTADPAATVPAVPGSSAGKANPPAFGKTKARNPRAATPTPGGHGRPNGHSPGE
jgi:hypothetical protein